MFGVSAKGDRKRLLVIYLQKGNVGESGPRTSHGRGEKANEMVELY